MNSGSKQRESSYLRPLSDRVIKISGRWKLARWSRNNSSPCNRLLVRNRFPHELREPGAGRDGVLATQRLQRDSFFLLRSVAVWPAPTSQRDTRVCCLRVAERGAVSVTSHFVSFWGSTCVLGPPAAEKGTTPGTARPSQMRRFPRPAATARCGLLWGSSGAHVRNRVGGTPPADPRGEPRPAHVGETAS